VIRPPTQSVLITCGGDPMTTVEDVDAPTSTRALVPTGGGTQLGKRYADDDAGLEVLCTKAGHGPLACDGKELTIRLPHALPSSD
jgi:hypothetical protein